MLKVKEWAASLASEIREFRHWEGSGPPQGKARLVGIQILSNYTNISLLVVTVLHHAYVIWFNNRSLHSLGDVSTRELTG